MNFNSRKGGAKVMQGFTMTCMQPGLVHVSLQVSLEHKKVCIGLQLLKMVMLRQL